MDSDLEEESPLFLDSFGQGNGKLMCQTCGHFDDDFVCGNCYKIIENDVISGTGRNFRITNFRFVLRFKYELFTCQRCKIPRHNLITGYLDGFGKVPETDFCVYCQIEYSSATPDSVCGNCMSFGTFTNDGHFFACGQDSNNELYPANQNVRKKFISKLKYEEGLLHQESIITFLLIWYFGEDDCPLFCSLPREIVNLIVYFVRELY